MEYSKLNLWLNNSEIADSWLMEYESHADKPDKLGTTIRAVRLQLHENQVCPGKIQIQHVLKNVGTKLSLNFSK